LFLATTLDDDGWLDTTAGLEVSDKGEKSFRYWKSNHGFWGVSTYPSHGTV
jgi:hypothetical protein